MEIASLNICDTNFEICFANIKLDKTIYNLTYIIIDTTPSNSVIFQIYLPDICKAQLVMSPNYEVTVKMIQKLQIFFQSFKQKNIITIILNVKIAIEKRNDF